MREWLIGQCSEDMGRNTCFRQFGIHDIGLEATRSAGICDKEMGLSLVLPGRVTNYRCQVCNPVSLDRSIRLDSIRHRHDTAMDKELNKRTHLSESS